jgi:ureidoacrylate peracid hydrolase
VRVLGGKIVYVRHIHDRDKLSRTMLDRSRRLYGSAEGFPLPDTWGATICPSVAPLDGEPVFDKHWYNAFSNPDFEAALAQEKVRTLVFVGVMTHVCVETTARAANTRDLYPVILEDCVGSDSEERHKAALENLSGYFGWVISSRDLLAMWRSR